MTTIGQERKQPIAQLPEAQDQFRAAIEAAPTGMLMINRDGEIVMVNAQIEKLFGYTRNELIGRPVEMLIPARFRGAHPGYRADFARAPRTRPMGRGRDLYGLRKDGTELPVEIGLNPLRTVEGDFVLSSVADITERRRAEQERESLTLQLQTLNAELEERVRIRTAQLSASLRERDVLLQEVHHRVKNNLQIISSLISLQMRNPERRGSKDALKECQSRVQAIALIHERLYQAESYSRVPFAEYACTLTTNVFQATGVSPARVSLELAIQDVTLPVGQAIPCGLLLNELLTNALKHAFRDGRHGTIRIELAGLEGGRIRLSVRDNGVGLPPGFDIQKVDSMGLHLVRTLSKQLGAELEVKSENGASFSLTFAEEQDAL